ncbi:MAG: phosphate acyltransferase [Gemmatimonadota bacterium]
MSFLARLAERSAVPRLIGFPEASEERTRAAIARLAAGPGPVPVAVTDGDARPPSGVRQLDLADDELRAQVLPFCPDLGAPGSGDTLRLAVAAVASGVLDGAVAGALATTADVLRAGLRILGCASGTDTVSGAFYLIVPAGEDGPERVLTFTDAAVVPRPDARQLAEIAAAACSARRSIVADEPRVAFLSYATRGSAEGEDIERLREALHLFRRRCPGVPADGELQADAALAPDVAARKAPDSDLAGDANILVFPDLASGNIAYKLVNRLAAAPAIGPILQGISRPLNDLSRGASIEDIVNVARVTALQATGSTSGQLSENV